MPVVASNLYTPSDNLTDAEKLTWLTSKTDGLGLSTQKVARFKALGIESPSDLIDFEDDVIDDIDRSLNVAVYEESTSTVDGKSVTEQKLKYPKDPLTVRQRYRLKWYIVAVEFMRKARLDFELGHVKWRTIANLKDEWKSFTASSDKDNEDLAAFGRKETSIQFFSRIYKWADTFIGELGISIKYLLMKDSDRDAEPPAPIPARAPDRLYAASRSSLKEELAARVDRNCIQALEDNKTLFLQLEKAVKGTQFAASAENFRDDKDGVGWLKHLLLTYGGADEHEKRAEEIIKWFIGFKWRGSQSGPLKLILAKFRTLKQELIDIKKVCPTVEVPSDRAFVKYLMDGITSQDAHIINDLSQIRKSRAAPGSTDYRNNLEETLNLLAQCPYAGKEKEGEKKSRMSLADISSTTLAEVSETSESTPSTRNRFEDAVKLKGGRGESGVEFVYHTNKEFRRLPARQQAELTQWRDWELYRKGHEKPSFTGKHYRYVFPNIPNGHDKPSQGGGGGGKGRGGTPGKSRSSAAKRDRKKMQAKIESLEATMKGVIAALNPDKDETPDTRKKKKARFVSPKVAAAYAVVKEHEAQEARASVSALEAFVVGDTTAGEDVSASSDSDMSVSESEDECSISGVNGGKSVENNTSKDDDVEKDLDARVSAARAVGLQSILKRKRKEAEDEKSLD